jgi:hypothetical protein
MKKIASLFVLFVMVPLALCSNEVLTLITPNKCYNSANGNPGELLGDWVNYDNACPNGYTSFLVFRTTIPIKPGIHYANCFDGGIPVVAAVDMDADYCSCDNYWADGYQVTIIGPPDCACQSGMACQSPWSEYFIGCI